MLPKVKNKAVFIDKDGTLIKDIPYNVDPELIIFEEYALEAMTVLQNKGYLLLIITNQSGVALGYFAEEDLKKLMKALYEKLIQQNIKVDGYYYCPHHPEGNITSYSITCNCRKPAPGMLLKAAEEFDIDLKRSWMIGDILNDIEAGSKAGCSTILIDNGNETKWVLNKTRIPDHIVSNLKKAAEIIINSKCTQYGKMV